MSRRKGQKGKLSGARVRRSVSTAYYALFHFLLLEAGVRLIGATNDLRRRRRTVARSFTHAGIKAALAKVRGVIVDPGVAGLLERNRQAAAQVRSPPFARNFAAAFIDAQKLRHEADYDLNATLSEADARRLVDRVEQAIADWRAANSAADRDFKHALCMLMLLHGRLRSEN